MAKLSIKTMQGGEFNISIANPLKSIKSMKSIKSCVTKIKKIKEKHPHDIGDAIATAIVSAGGIYAACVGIYILIHHVL